MVLVFGVVDNNGKKFKVMSFGEGRVLRRFFVVGVLSILFVIGNFFDCVVGVNFWDLEEEFLVL